MLPVHRIHLKRKTILRLQLKATQCLFKATWKLVRELSVPATVCEVATVIAPRMCVSCCAQP